jgi:ABC-type dipeptide/oligopeptide/nickel transport system permease subunit
VVDAREECIAVAAVPAEAGDLASSIGAYAFTHGTHVYFASPEGWTNAEKYELSPGYVVASRVIMPAVPFGLADQNRAEYFRPPTWSDEAEISPEGYYVRGVRAQRSASSDGFVTTALPVVTQSVEPAGNDGLRHPLGTDSLGRDMLARTIWGGRAPGRSAVRSSIHTTMASTPRRLRGQGRE